MASQTLDTILALTTLGYTIRFTKNLGFMCGPSEVEIRISKDNSTTSATVDLTLANGNLDRLIASIIDEARWNLDRFIRKQNGGTE